VKLNALALAFIALIALAGCSSSPTPTSTPSRSGTSQVATSTASPTASETVSAEAKAAFKLIAHASCNAAQNTGVVESSNNYVQVMASAAQVYQGFSMAYLQKPAKYGVIEESIVGFAACRDWYAFSMADDAGQEAPIDVSFNQTDKSYTVSQNGDSGPTQFLYRVKNNLIVSALNLEDVAAGTSTLTYGALNAEAIAILKTAADTQLESPSK
jgi:hypothetical protein